ncbi:MAG: AAA family ATPase, partial [Oligoflexales bacterium]|nr:AAA family ATPase [Oligoflexales bacterium]
MSPMSAEATVVRNYIETVLYLPWGEYTSDIQDINYAEKILERDHYGLQAVKDRILEYLSVRTLTNSMKGPILCLVGPPGVGKTSLARSVASATGKKFVRLSLGGVRDEAEVRGHRRTYIGSMPGKIVMSIKKAGSSNPVMLLDEIDKLSHDFRGDPSSALLEVLDPEQNHTFNDHYLDVDFDLSKVLFMATANTLDTVPPALLDRMEIISISGYMEDEKIAIATQYLVPKQLRENGLESHEVTFTPGAVRELARYYTRESGVRGLEREIGSVLRKLARKHMQKKGDDPEEQDEAASSGKSADAKAKEIKPPKTDILVGKITESVTEGSIKKYLGPRKFRISPQNAQDEVGLATGLAWTKVGGELLVTEVAMLQGSGKLTLTGKL